MCFSFTCHSGYATKNGRGANHGVQAGCDAVLALTHGWALAMENPVVWIVSVNERPSFKSHVWFNLSDSSQPMPSIRVHSSIFALNIWFQVWFTRKYFKSAMTEE